MKKETLDYIFTQLYDDKEFKEELEHKISETIIEYVDWVLYQITRDDDDSDIQKSIKSMVREVLKENKDIFKWRLAEQIKEKYIK